MGVDPFVMSGTIRVRRVHFDYAGADGLPKPMTWVMAGEAAFDKDDYARRVREIFRAQFPGEPGVGTPTVISIYRPCQEPERPRALFHEPEPPPHEALPPRALFALPEPLFQLAEPPR